MKSPLVRAWPPIRSSAYRREMRALKRRLWSGRSRGAILRKLCEGEAGVDELAWLEFSRIPDPRMYTNTSPAGVHASRNQRKMDPRTPAGLVLVYILGARRGSTCRAAGSWLVAAEKIVGGDVTGWPAGRHRPQDFVRALRVPMLPLSATFERVPMLPLSYLCILFVPCVCRCYL